MPTESPLTQRAAGLRTHTTFAVGEHCKQSTPVERTQASSGRQALETLGLSTSRLPQSITLLPGGNELPFRGAFDHRETGRGAQPGESALAGSNRTPAESREESLPRQPVADSKMNSPGRLYGSTRLPLSGFTYY